MLIPAIVNIFSYFYPIGNTPAVSLIEDLPNEEDADILLLGCGDVRNILFTVYSDSARTCFRERQLDFTCCDLEPAVLARNVLLFTLILDDEQGENSASIWDIYYHFFLDKLSLQLLKEQVKKLAQLGSLEQWHRSKYGKVLRFCDQGTYTTVVKIWKAYCPLDELEDQVSRLSGRLSQGIKRAMETRKTNVGMMPIYTGVRSASPIAMEASKDLPMLDQAFWENGSTDQDSSILSRSRHPNPMFASVTSNNFTIHYGTDPLLGFHLASAYLPFVPGTSLDPKNRLHPRTHKLVAAAQTEFYTWAVAFRQRSRFNLRVRVFSGDGIAFCYALLHAKSCGVSTPSHWYRAAYGMQPLKLDGEDYNSPATAPTTFNVIDTSNLVDHFGALNFLVAASPLLANTTSASLYTETLVNRQGTREAWLKEFLSGDFSSISIMLGLFPVEYWTACTSVSPGDEVFMNMLSGQSVHGREQMHSRLTWKWTVSTSIPGQPTVASGNICYQETELAQVLYQVYLEMFQHENIAKMLANLTTTTAVNNSMPFYNRGSFVALLSLIRTRASVDWNKTMFHLIQLLKNDQSLMVGGNYLQELSTQLYLSGVYTDPILHDPPRPLGKMGNGLHQWVGIPPVLCINLRVPRSKLGILTKVPSHKLGALILHSSVTTPRWNNIFGIVQLAFGKVITSGTRYSPDFKIDVEEDERAWEGNSPLVVSFYAPTYMILLEYPTASVSCGLQSTPQAVANFARILGHDMNIYSATLGDEENVFITKYRPNHSGHPSMHAIGALNNSKAPSSQFMSSMSAIFSTDKRKIQILTSRISTFTKEDTAYIRDGANIKSKQISPCIVELVVGKSSSSYRLHFPAPVVLARGQTRIARKSMYIEVEAPIASFADTTTFPNFMSPIYVSSNKSIVTWNTPHLNFETLPALDLAKSKDLQWLRTYVAFQFSARERAIRNQGMSTKTVPEDVRVNFKDSLMSLFCRFIELQPPFTAPITRRIFGISNKKAGGAQILIFISSMRLLLSSRSIVLDAAILPLTFELMPALIPYIQEVTNKEGAKEIEVNDKEMRLWKEVLPSFVERCRDWAHVPTCEYQIAGKVPLSYETGEPLLCSCGKGKLPSDFLTSADVIGWKFFSQHATRVAISPAFCVPFVEKPYDPRSTPSFPGEAKKGVNGLNGDRRRKCDTCNKSPGSSRELFKCSRCQSAKYCSKDCQRKNWKIHKKICIEKTQDDEGGYDLD